MKNLFASVLFTLFVAGCAPEAKEKPGPAPVVPAAAPAATPMVIATAEVHDAICGHVLKEVGHCGNYVKLDGKYIELKYPSLGKMEYCSAGEKGAKVEITGKLTDGKFVADTYRRVE